MGSRLVVSVSKAKRPAARACAIQASSCGSSVTVSYFDRSILAGRRLQRGDDGGAPGLRPTRRAGLAALLAPALSAALAVAARGVEPPAARSTAAAPRRPALRRCAWSASRIPSRAGSRAALSGSGSRTPSCSTGTSRGTSSLSVTSSRDSRACMANSVSRSRRLGCLISPARASSVSRSPYSLISSAAVLTPMPGTPGTLSVESPASACTSTTLSGGTPNLSRTSSGPMVLFFMVSSIDTPGLDQLHQVLVGGDDRHVAAGGQRLLGVGGDQVVGLVAVLLDAGDVEGLDGVADQRELRHQLFGRRRAMRLVVLVDLVAERLLAGVEDDGQMRRPAALAGVLQQLPQHGAEAVHGADRQAVGRARQRRQRVEGAEDVARAVDQVDVAALDDRHRLARRHGAGRQRPARTSWVLQMWWPWARTIGRRAGKSAR